MTDKFEQLEAYFEDLSDNGKWLIDEVRRLRSEQGITFDKQRQLNQRLHNIWARLHPVVDHNHSADLLVIVDIVVAELTQLRAKEAAPLSDYDRVGKIMENVSKKVYDKQARTDIVWLTQEISKLRGLVKWVNNQLDASTTGTWVPSAHRDNTREIVKISTHHLRGRASELAKIHDILAEALGYEKAPTAEEDPNCPCPGAYITGDHTSETLAMEAARNIQQLQQENDVLRDQVAQLVRRPRIDDFGFGD